MNKSLATITLLAFAALLVQNLLSSHQNSDEFQQWKSDYAVSFENQADQFYRRSIFFSNLAKINAHNSASSTYRMAVNQFTIYTEEQFAERFLTKSMQPTANVEKAVESSSVEAVIIDWAEKGAVGPVRNQGVCGSGVLYGTLGVVEGLGKIVTGTFQSFSAQQLMDCVFGCTGSMISSGYDYYKAHSVCTTAEYPETGKVGACQNKKCGFTISGYQNINGCNDLASMLQKQPLAVTVDASKWAAYSSGIFSNCGTSINHLVLLTGMADEYWKCKNSWGTAWGEKGYIRLSRGNTCGICTSASYPKH